MYPIFDSHAHYDDKRFNEDRTELLASMPEKGVDRIINAASNLDSADKSIELAEAFDFVYAAAGVHPHAAKTWDESSEERILRQLAHKKVVAVGEIGLDYHYDYSPRDVQRDVLRRQIEIAKRLDLPVILHDREAHGDMYEILREFAPLKGVMHCFSGSVELAAETIRYGLHIGLGGAVTFKNARVPLEVAAYVPLDRLLVETDAPYMAPVPRRGERCDSAMISLTAEKIAEVRGITADDVLSAAYKNACELFGVE